MSRRTYTPGQYDTLDSIILSALANTSVPMPFRQLQHHGEINREALRLADTTGSDAFRIVDARLAHLRKKGKIQPAPKRAGWEIAA